MRLWEILAIAAGVLLLFLLRSGISYYIGMKANQRQADARAEKIVAARRGSPTANLSKLKGDGRIYLVQIGPHTAPYALEDFAGWLHSKYSLDVQILPPMAAVSSAWNAGRKQYVAQLLCEELKRQHSELTDDPHAYLIGFTDADMFTVTQNWKSTFTQRDSKRAAVISSEGMEDSLLQRIEEGRETANRHFEARLRRILLKDVAILYWHLSLNNDPTSLLQQILDPDIPLEDIYQSDLAPEHTRWGRSEGEPCIFFTYSAKDGVQPLSGELIRSCGADMEDVSRDESREIFEVDLRLGLLVDKHTDFYLPDTVPIQFQRNTRDGWRGPMGFGISGTHNYDKYLGSFDGMRTISIYQPDGGKYDMRRVPSWLPLLSRVKYVDADFSGSESEMRWHAEPPGRFIRTSYNGVVETYLPCSQTSPPCYQVGYRNAQGQDLIFERNTQRKLTQLTSPKRNSLHLNYGADGNISDIRDSRGRNVRYSYDDRGRLVRVAYPSGEIFNYEYDSTQHLLNVSTAPDSSRKPLVLVRNEYEHGKIVKQTFSDGKTYTYSYDPADADEVRSATVHTPDGTIFDLRIAGTSSNIRVRETQQKE